MIKFMVIARMEGLIEGVVMGYDALQVSNDFEDEELLKQDFISKLQEAYNLKSDIEILDYQTMSAVALRYYIACDPTTIESGDIIKVIDQAS